jgi:hypothetical protein
VNPFYRFAEQPGNTQDRQLAAILRVAVEGDRIGNDQFPDG